MNDHVIWFTASKILKNVFLWINESKADILTLCCDPKAFGLGNVVPSNISLIHFESDTVKHLCVIL